MRTNLYQSDSALFMKHIWTGHEWCFHILGSSGGSAGHGLSWCVWAASWDLCGGMCVTEGSTVWFSLFCFSALDTGGGRGSVKSAEWVSLWKSTPLAKLYCKCLMILSFSSFREQRSVIWNPYVSFFTLCCCLGRKPKQWKQKWGMLSLCIWFLWNFRGKCS